MLETEILFREKYKNHEEIEIKPCPFCGGKAKMKHGFPKTQKKGEYQALIQCTKCGCRTPISHQVAFEPKWQVDYFVVSLWNMRVSDNPELLEGGGGESETD